MYDVSSEKVQYSGPDVLAVILLGIIGGIFGSLYNYLVDKVLRTYSIINKYVTVLSYLITAGCFFF
jgi:chloride channel 7